MKHLTFSLTGTLFFFFLTNCLTAQSNQSKLVITPYTNNVEDAIISSIIPNSNRGTVPGFNGYAWTQSGSVNVTRSLIRFDLSSIPADAEILDAKLVLHFDPFSTTGQPAHSGNTAFYIRRLIGDWEELGVTWNNQPDYTTDDEILIPTAAFNEQNYVIDVKDLLSAILEDTIIGNQGFMLQLQDESPYNAVLLCSKDNPDISRHPQLNITYQSDGMVGNEDVAFKKGDLDCFKIFPNPTSDYFHVVASENCDFKGMRVSLYDATGMLVEAHNLTNTTSVIRLSKLPKGTYFVKITDSQNNLLHEENLMLMK